MRTWWAVGLLLSMALAGCVEGDGPDPAVDGTEAPAYRPVCTAPVPEWTDPCTSLVSHNDSPSKTEVDLVVNPADPDNIVVASKDLDRAASDCVWSVAQVTHDGGETWTTVYVGGDLEAREPVLAPFACVTDPIMAFEEDGTLHYALQAYRLGAGPTQLPNGEVQPIIGSSFILATSHDGGLTWDTYAAQHLGDGPVVFHDYPRMLVNPATGTIHTIWNGVGDGGVSPWVSSSRDGGETLDPPVTFWAEGAERSTAFASGFDANANGTLFVTTWVDQEPVRTFHLFRSDDDGRSFQHIGPAVEVCYPPRSQPHHEFRTPGFVELAIDRTTVGHPDRLYANWTDHCTGDMDVLVAWSDDEGLSWSDPVRVNDDDPTSGTDQFFPRGAVDVTGTLHILFDDRRWDPNNLLLDMTHAYSSDGGLTWTNQRLTATSFDGDLGLHQNGFPFIGDYNGIDVEGTTVHMAWGDTRTGRAEIAYQRVEAPHGVDTA